MKKSLYIILLLAELLAGFPLLLLVTSAMGWTFFWTVTAVWAILMVLLLVKLKKAADGKGKFMVKVAIALAMLVPAAGALAGLGWFVWAMTSAGW